MPDIDSPKTDDVPESDLALRWSGRVSLTRRILAVNVLALALLGGGFFYLDSYRSRLVDSRVQAANREVRLIAEALRSTPPRELEALVARLARETHTRIRLYGADDALVADSRAIGVANFRLRDPDKQGWDQAAARWLDAGIDIVVRADRAPLFREKRPDRGEEWPGVDFVRDGTATRAQVLRAPDRTPVIQAFAALEPGGRVVSTTVNARDITETVRSERFRLGLVVAVASLISILLSLFLARTIVRPLRRLARAAVRVRLGRAREVVVPRLPSRRDEIGLLARAVSDMSQALRVRIDATEAFAADVTHEMKNPLASLRSAVESLSSVKDPALQARLLAIVRDDVHRLDRLISDISDASRLEAQLSRAKFEAVDLDAMIRAVLAVRAERGSDADVRLDYRPAPQSMVVLGEGSRLERVVENLIDNAVSFSPTDATVIIAAERDAGELVLSVADAGPGVPETERETIFRRFHSVRPEGEAFGRHSGLGLAIARTIVEGHQGTIAVESRDDGVPGARFLVRLPLAEVE